MVKRDTDKRASAKRATGLDAVGRNKANHDRRSDLRLLADIGGTNIRLAVQRQGEDARKLRRYRCADFPDILTAVRTYCRDAKIRGSLPTVAAFAIAAPITSDRVHMTNHPWTFSIEAVRKALGLDVLVVVNDFLAIAESIPFLKTSERRKIGGGRGVPRAPMAVVGPGTGLGVGALIPDDDGQWHAIATEGGHATMAAADDREAAVIQKIRRDHRHVSAERCLSGGGLVNLHRALAANQRIKAPELTPPAVTRRAQQGDTLAREAITMFSAMLGATAGNLALIFGAVGGVYIAGGIVPKLGPLFDTRLFNLRFAGKGRYRNYLSTVPIYLITHPLPALIGLATLLDRKARATIAVTSAAVTSAAVTSAAVTSA